MSLYKRLKKKSMVEDEKELLELVFLRQVKLDNKIVENSQLKLNKKIKYKAQVGILTKTI